MGGFGDRLRQERESRGLRLVDVARATKVGAHHLVALEYGDFGALPEHAAVEGFVRRYAEHLGLDPDTAVADLAQAMEAHRPPPAKAGEEEEPEALPVAVAREPEIPEAPPVAAPAAPPPEPPSMATGDAAPAAPESTAPPPAAAGTSAVPARGIGRWILAFGVALAVVVVLTGWWWVSADGGSGTRLPSTPLEASPSPPPPQASTAEIAPMEEARSAPVAEVRVEGDPVSDTRPPSSPSGLVVPEHGVGTGIVDHRLVGRATSFPEGTRVWFWTRVQRGGRGVRIRHIWIHEGEAIMSIPLELGGPDWRTQSRKTLSEGSAGAWVVEARDAASRVLARDEFVCVAPD